MSFYIRIGGLPAGAEYWWPRFDIGPDVWAPPSKITVATKWRCPMDAGYETVCDYGANIYNIIGIWMGFHKVDNVKVGNGGTYYHSYTKNTFTVSVPPTPPPEPPPGPYYLTISISPSGSGKVTVTDGVGPYEAGKAVMLRAISYTNYKFDHWSGDASGTAYLITVVMDKNRYIIANFKSTAPEPGTLLEQIIAWISARLEELKAALRTMVQTVLTPVQNAIINAISWATSPITTTVNWLKAKASDIWNTVKGLPAAISGITANIGSIVSSAVSSAIGVVSSWISNAASSIKSWVTTKVGQVLPWIQTYTAKVRDDISLRLTTTKDFLYEHLIANNALLGALQAGIPPLFLTNLAKIEATGTDIMGHEDAGFANLKTWFTENVTDPITDWFKEWWTDLKTRMTGVWTTIITWIKTFFTETIPDLATALWTKMKAAAAWVNDAVSGLLTDAFEHVLGLLSAIAPIAPEGGLGAFTGISKVGIALAGGLGLMTVAGNLVHPLHSLGFEHVSAMVYDLTNYKMLTGAMIGALAATAIRTPITYYFNSMLRPWLLDRRSFMDLMSRRAFTDPESLRNPDLTTTVHALAPAGGRSFESAMIGYFGNPAQYYGFFKELANTPLRYFPLAGIARTGFFETVWFTEALHRSGYSQTAVDALMVMYRKMADESVRGMMSGAAVTRFKEGFTTEEQFSSEMALLGYSDIQFQTYLAAARLDYATDYIRDLLTAYRDAVRKGHIGLDEYRSSLLGLGMVPERVEGYILKERARLKPTEPLTPIAPPTPEYETDAGKIKVDTIRRSRRKTLISRDQEISSLQFLGMDPDLAKAMAANDDIRLAEKAE